MSYEVARICILKKMSGAVPVHETQTCKDLLKCSVFASLWFGQGHESLNDLGWTAQPKAATEISILTTLAKEKTWNDAGISHREISGDEQQVHMKLQGIWSNQHGYEKVII